MPTASSNTLLLVTKIGKVKHNLILFNSQFPPDLFTTLCQPPPNSSHLLLEAGVGQSLDLQQLRRVEERPQRFRRHVHLTLVHVGDDGRQVTVRDAVQNDDRVRTGVVLGTRVNRPS